MELTSAPTERLLQLLRSQLGAVFDCDRSDHFLAPPVMARGTAERAGYPDTFPQLLGSVHAAPNGGDPAATDLVLTPAACHHVYPLVADRVLDRSLTFGVEAPCFRAEASSEPGRLRSFRMYEVVRIGPADELTAWRDIQLDKMAQWLTSLGLEPTLAPASDPFFGRPGRLMAQTQLGQQLKWEAMVAVADGLEQAVASANYHKAHFGETFDITDPQGQELHSACVAFGLDRIVLALRHRHGAGLESWMEEQS